MARIVCWFSCGAASAVATKLAIENMERKGSDELVIAYCDLSKREHPDNARFLRDCEQWFGREIIVVGNDDYDRDPDQVFLKTKFLIGVKGARCTAELKKSVRWGFQKPTDIVVLGYTTEEFKRRHTRLAQSEPLTNFWPVLHESGITKPDCLRMVREAGIELPEMYRLGYKNNNCIGCVKGGMGYWNKVRVDFPERFAEMAVIEQKLGRTVLKKRWREDGKVRSKPISLLDLPPDLGSYEAEPDIECGILCHTAEG